MEYLAILAVAAGVAVAITWQATSRGRVFVIRIRNRVPLLTRGKVSQAFVTELAEVLNTSAGIFKAKWFFAKDDAKLLGFELRQQDLNEDPCEVYFSDYKAVDGRQLPHRIQVYYRDVHYGTFTVTSYKFAN